MHGANRVMAKDVKSCTYGRYVRCATLIVCVVGIPWSQTGALRYHAQLELPDKGRAIKLLVVCYQVLLGSMKGMGLIACRRCTTGSAPML